ncbi:rhamnulokinase [Candidatus Galacturonibacter soehngenii]|uniref:Rhamnulokinase n=1 Tax=Candidatus Galacturonatibacter soehngenii TaxID=2307010 RepID=A0A7V7UB88_9FIRM|nr:rhamnulokinase family protein [Candidatus Galacturonibacter soehngenii]KAB1437520.1 rhamnulokinase [Candidatus Galacturonibacter soehngenii]MBA4688458.1 rhamnulokinase [Candidatus Galacturonibacter soehngenii]
MNTPIYNLAFDFGASSGRLILSKYDGSKIELEEIHRFTNDPVRIGKNFYWDTFRLYHELKTGLKKAASKKIPITSLAIDTWGVDYGLIDKDGNLIGNPVNYRDDRTIGVIEEVDKIVPLKEVYASTGIQFMNFNTIFQFYADKKMRPDIYEKADKFLMMPDLFNYFLTGKMYNEYTNASTGQLLDAKERFWDLDLIKKLGLRTDLFCEMIKPGSIVGELIDEVVKETGLTGVKVIAVGSHDTASAVAGTPFEEENAAFLSCGTWSLLGMEIDEPVLTEESYQYNYTNEGGVEGKIRLLKNINGLWIMQNLRRNWCEFEAEVSFPDIIKASREAKRKDFIIDPNDQRFTAPYNMMNEVIAYCEENGQGKPEGLGEIAMAIYNGLTNEYKTTVKNLEVITGKSIPCINMVGGGIQDQLLCELTANATGKKVVAGPIEGSVLGNVVMQLKAVGAISSLEEGRKIIKASFEQKVHMPS